jgi:hypothetical protein
LDKGVGSGNDQIVAAVQDFPSKVGVTLVVALCGKSFDDQVSSLRIPQSTELGEKSGPSGPSARFGKAGGAIDSFSQWLQALGQRYLDEATVSA